VPSEGVNVTKAKRFPREQDISIESSDMPVTGMSKSSRAARSPGSPKAAITAAYASPRLSARTVRTAAPAICASARDEI